MRTLKTLIFAKKTGGEAVTLDPVVIVDDTLCA